MATSWGVSLERSEDDSPSSEIEQILRDNSDPQSFPVSHGGPVHGQISHSASSSPRHSVLTIDDALNLVGLKEVETTPSYKAQKKDSFVTSSCADQHEQPQQLPYNQAPASQECFSNEKDLNLRKSTRNRQKKRSFSPNSRGQDGTAKKKKVKHKKSPARSAAVRPYDKLADGTPFCCDICRSPYVCNPHRRGNQVKRSKHQPTPRHKVDPATGKVLTLCNPCGLAMERKKKVKRDKVVPSAEEKQAYMEEAHNFALSLVEGFNDMDAERLCCPYFKSKACGCMQRYILGDGQTAEESRKRAQHLLSLLKEAKKLSSQKCYSIEEFIGADGKSKKTKNIGLGNGQKRSKSFEEFVMLKRSYLREELKLCERASQRVLMYSNNFLHKKLKTDPRICRAERVKGQAALGKLKSIKELIKEKCCIDNCVMIALTHYKLLEQWRDRALSGQTEARRVMAEMLTPSGGPRANCYRFISLVTGCSPGTIGRVNEQMRQTNGIREPPPHGMKTYWQNKPRGNVKEKDPLPEPMIVIEQSDDPYMEMSDNDSNHDNTEDNQTMHFQAVPVTSSMQEPSQSATVSTATTQLTANDSPLDQLHQTYRQQLIMLQQQLSQQQNQLQQQQQVIQQQLLHQVLMDAQNAQPNPNSSSIHFQTLQSLQQLLNLQQQYQQQQQQQLTLLQQPVMSGDQQPGQQNTELVVQDQETISASEQSIINLGQGQQLVHIDQGQGQVEITDTSISNTSQLSQQLQVLLEGANSQTKEGNQEGRKEEHSEKDVLADIRSLLTGSSTSPILGLLSASHSATSLGQPTPTSQAATCMTLPTLTLTSPITVPTLSTIGNTHNILSTLNLPPVSSSAASQSSTSGATGMVTHSSHTTTVSSSCISTPTFGTSSSPGQMLPNNAPSPVQLLSSHSTSPVQAVVQQILDLNALNMGANSQASNLSHLSDFTSGLSSNVNIALVPPSAFSSAGQEATPDTTISLDQSLAQLLNPSAVNYVFVDPAPASDGTVTATVGSGTEEVSTSAPSGGTTCSSGRTTNSVTTSTNLVPAVSSETEVSVAETGDQSRNESPSFPVDVLQLLAQSGFSVIKTS